MRILLIEPYFTGSHAAWAVGYRESSSYQIEILSMPGVYWKWRMESGAVTLARRFLENPIVPDLILASDMLDLSTFLSLTREVTSHVPCMIYFHENQITYPWSQQDRDLQQGRDRHYGFMNFRSALCADLNLFNSNFHRRSFLEELPRFLRGFPDHRETDQVEEIRKRSQVLPLGLDLRGMNGGDPAERTNGVPTVVWNHRWEYDKNPSEFFWALKQVRERGVDFRLIVLGENFSKRPTEFDEAKRTFDREILHWGYCESREEYATWLQRGDILAVTSHQDFFGGSVVEAIACECFPLLPNRLAYPELVPESLHNQCFYESPDALVDRLCEVLRGGTRPAMTELRDYVLRFDWSRMAPIYDQLFSKYS